MVAMVGHHLCIECSSAREGGRLIQYMPVLHENRSQERGERPGESECVFRSQATAEGIENAQQNAPSLMSCLKVKGLAQINHEAVKIRTCLLIIDRHCHVSINDGSGKQLQAGATTKYGRFQTLVIPDLIRDP